MAVVAELAGVVADVADRGAGDVGEVDARVGGDLAGDDAPGRWSRSVSTATREAGYSASAASRMASEIWSAILSGCPSVTDSEVKWYPSWSCGSRDYPLLGTGGRAVAPGSRAGAGVGGRGAAASGWPPGLRGSAAGGGPAAISAARTWPRRHHSGELRAGDVGQQVAQAAVGIDHEPFRAARSAAPAGSASRPGRGTPPARSSRRSRRAPGRDPSGAARAGSGPRRRSWRTPAPAGPRCLLDRREQEVVVPLPQRPGVPVAVADVQRPARRRRPRSRC